MKKRVFILILGLLVTVLIGSTWLYVTRPIRIGVILPTDSALGNEENLMVRFYSNHQSKIGLRPVEFVIRNVSGETAVKAAYDELNALNVSVILGGVLSQDGLWLAEKSAALQIPTFGITASSSLLSQKEDAFYRLVPTNDVQARTVAHYLYSIGVQRLVLLSSVENQTYALPYTSMIQATFVGDVLTLQYSDSDSLYDAVMAFEPDAVFCVLQASDVIKVITRLKAEHPNLIIGSSSWGSSEIVSLYSSPILDGVLLFENDDSIRDEAYLPDIQAFESLYAIDATKGSNYTLSVLSTVYQGLQKVGDDREKLIAYFNTPREYPTVYGPAIMDTYGDTAIDLLMLLQTSQGKVINRIEIPMNP